MFVLYDGLPMQSGSRHRGIGRYSANLLAGLKRVRPHWHIELVEHAHLAPIDPDLSDDFPVRTFCCPVPFRPEIRDFADRYFADWIVAQRPDWAFQPSPFEHDGAVPLYSWNRPRTVGIMYDLIPVVMADEYLGGSDISGYSGRVREASKLDLLLAISNASALDAIRLMGDEAPEVVNIRGAAFDALTPIAPESLPIAERLVRGKFDIHKPFVLYVGGPDPRKNMTGAIRAFAELPAAVRSEFDLVLSCWLPDHQKRELASFARTLGVADSLRVTGFVSDQELVVLYQTCRLFFFPSRYEGLGLPPVEAMLCGAPVVTSNVSSMPEYGGEVCWYCDPDCPRSMADAILRALAEPKDQGRAERQTFAASFTWDDVAERAAKAIENAAPREVLPRRKRIAWVSPMTESAVGLALALGDRFDIDWIVDPEAAVADLAVARRWRTVLAPDLATRQAAQPYDLFVYHFADRPEHAYQLPLLERFPGIVVLHDIAYGTLFEAANRRGIWPGNGATELCYDNDWHDSLHGRELAGTLNRRIIERATDVVVHSRSTRDRLRRLTAQPVLQLPQFVAEPRSTDRGAARHRFKLDDDHFAIAVLGPLRTAKRLRPLLKSLASLSLDVRSRLSLLVVGPVLQTELDEDATSFGLAGQIRRLDADFAAVLASADLGVQVRDASHGDTATCVFAALAAGLACIATEDFAPNEPEIAKVFEHPHRDRPALSQALDGLIRNASRRLELGSRARDFVRRAHGPSAVAAAHASAFGLAIAREEARDGQWTTAAANALSILPGRVPADLLAHWAALRSTAISRRHRPAA